MGEGLWQNLKNVFGGTKGGGKKPVSSWLLMVLVCLGILMMFVNAKPKQTDMPAVPSEESREVLSINNKPQFKDSLERELTALLKRVHGVGDVVVMVTLESGPVYEYAYNSEATGRTTQEEDSNGGTRVITESTDRDQIVIARSNGNEETALITREMQPCLSGVMVIAEGAEHPEVYERLFRAVQSGLNIAAHRIIILPMKR